MAEPLDDKVRFVINEFERSKEFYTPIRSKFKDWDDMYYAIPPSKKYSWMENVFIPATFKAIRTISARIMAMNFATDPPFDLVPLSPEAERSREGVKGYLKYQLDKSQFFSKWFLAVLQSLTRGTSIQKTYWVDRYEKRMLRKPIVDAFGKVTGFEKKKDTVPIYNGPWVDVIDNYDFFASPDCMAMNDGTTQIHRLWRNIDHIKKHKETYKNIDKLEATTAPGREDDYQHIRQLNVGISRRNFGEIYDAYGQVYEGEKHDNRANLTQDIEILECYCYYDIDNDGKLEDCLFAIGNREVLLREELNPFIDRPFSAITFVPVLGELYGMGVCELIEPLQAMLNTKTNQRLDNVNQVLQCIMTYIDGSIDPGLLKKFDFRPGAKLPVGMPDAIKWERPPDVTQSAYIETDKLVGEIEEVSGATRYVGPTSSGQKDLHRTSTGLAMLQSAAGEWLTIVVKLMEQSGIREIIKQYHILNQQNIEDKVEYPFFAKGVYTRIQLTLEDIAQDYDFKAVGASHWSSKEMETGFINQLLQIIAPDERLSEIKLELIKKLSKNFNMSDIEVKIDKMMEQLRQPQFAPPGLQPGGGNGGGRPQMPQGVSLPSSVMRPPGPPPVSVRGAG